MKVQELQRIISEYFDAETDQKRVMCAIGTAVVGLSRVELGISGATHWINTCRAEINRNPEFSRKYQECLKEIIKSEILFPA
jgi:hypothetical protein